MGRAPATCLVFWSTKLGCVEHVEMGDQQKPNRCRNRGSISFPAKVNPFDDTHSPTTWRAPKRRFGRCDQRTSLLATSWGRDKVVETKKQTLFVNEKTQLTGKSTIYLYIIYIYYIYYIYIIYIWWLAYFNAFRRGISHCRVWLPQGFQDIQEIEVSNGLVNCSEYLSCDPKSSFHTPRFWGIRHFMAHC